MKNILMFGFTILWCTIAYTKQPVESVAVKKPATNTAVQSQPALAEYKEKLRSLIQELKFAKNNEAKRAIIEQIKQLHTEMRRARLNKSPLLSKDKHAIDSVKQVFDKRRMKKPIDQEVNESATDGETITTYHVPFASSGNRIELAIVNDALQLTNSVTVKAIEVPATIHISPSVQQVSNIEQNKEQTVVFTFTIERNAPITLEQTLTFLIANERVEQRKHIRIVVDKPTTFELFQNYPNPFNPVTVISYQLPVNSLVTLKVYNILGEEVSTLVNEVQDAGYKTVNFSAKGRSTSGRDGVNYSSGVYFYRLSAQQVVDDPTRRESSTGSFLKVGKMMLTK